MRASCPSVKASVCNPISEETPVKFRHTCFPPTHPYNKISTGLSVDLSFYGLDKKFADTSFFTNTLSRLNKSKRASLTKSCLYLKPQNSLQQTTFSPKVFWHASRQTGHTSSNMKLRNHEAIFEDNTRVY